MKSVLLLLLTVSVGMSQTANALMPKKDINGAKDHPLISRYPGSVITHYNVTDYDEYQFPTGVLNNNKLPVKTVEGKYTTIVYKLPKELSTLQVFKNYEKAFQKAKVKQQLSCKQSTCGDYLPKHFLQTQGGGNAKAARYIGVDVYNTSANRSDYRFWSGVLTKNGTQTYITFMVNKNSATIDAFIDLVEVKQMETGLVALNLDSLSESIKSDGKAVLSGIYFDTDKATIKPESEPSFKIIAMFLKSNPNSKTYVVGHTDNHGSFEHNMDLSKQRADSVVSELVNKYQVPKQQLVAVGVGPVSPAASNADDAGREQNRRVELVLR